MFVVGNLVSFYVSECSSVNTSSLPQLPNSLTCSLASSCTTVKCCMDTAWLGKTVTLEFNLDKCDIVLSAQIETFQRSLNLFDLEMGKSVFKAFMRTVDPLFINFFFSSFGPSNEIIVLL